MIDELDFMIEDLKIQWERDKKEKEFYEQLKYKGKYYYIWLEINNKQDNDKNFYDFVELYTNDPIEQDRIYEENNYYWLYNEEEN